MLVSLNRGSVQSPPTDAIDFLLECHERIRRFSGIAVRLAEEAHAPAVDAADAARQLLRYFRESLPDHALDEDGTLTPRLLDHTPLELADALNRQARDHAEHEATLAALCRHWERIAAGEPTDRVELVTLSRSLRAHFAEHLRLEEEEIFPAARRILGQDELRRLGAAMRDRRMRRLTGR